MYIGETDHTDGCIYQRHVTQREVYRRDLDTQMDVYTRDRTHRGKYIGETGHTEGCI